MNNTKINFLEASFLVVIVTITHLLLDLPNALIKSTGSASVLNAIYISILALIYFFIVKKLLSPFDGNNILHVAEFLGGKFLKRVLTIIYISYFAFISAIMIRNFGDTLRLIYFPQATLWSVLGIMVLVAVIVNHMGAGSVIKVNTFIIPPILLTIVITAFSLIGKLEPNRLFPVMGYGFKETFIFGASNIYAFSGLVYIYLIRPNLKNYKDFTKLGVTSILLSAMYLVVCILALVMLFPYLTSGNETLSIYLSTRVIEYGKFMQRADALYMFVWLFDCLSYLSVMILYIKHIGTQAIEVKQGNLFTIIIGIVIFIIALLPQNTVQVEFIESTVYKYLSLGIVFGLSFVILLLGYIKKTESRFSKFILH